MGSHSFKDLKRHIGHKIVCVSYGGTDGIWNVAIECETCNEVLLDFDYESEEEAERRRLRSAIYCHNQRARSLGFKE